MPIWKIQDPTKDCFKEEFEKKKKGQIICPDTSGQTRCPDLEVWFPFSPEGCYNLGLATALTSTQEKDGPLSVWSPGYKPQE